MLSSGPLGTVDATLDHERLTSLINSMADGVIATDEVARIVMYNGAALNILDVNSTITGRTLSDTLHLIDKNNQPVDFQSLILKTTTALTNRDLRLQYPDKSTINLYLSIAPVRLGFGKGGDRGFVILLRDITREKSLEEERDEFISVISHELRTPVAIAEGNISNAQFIVDKSGDASQIKKALDDAHNQITLLSDLINDLSTLSRAENAKLNIEIEPINAHELCEELVQDQLPDAAKKGLALTASLDPNLQVLKSSKLYAHEILQNFVTNAIKYTETGSVTVGAQNKPSGILFFVTDTGIGISKPDQEKIFDKFFRSEDFRTRKTNGTGLGLYITMKLARLIHAEISMQSELNKGSTFSIYMPNLE